MKFNSEIKIKTGSFAVLSIHLFIAFFIVATIEQVIPNGNITILSIVVFSLSIILSIRKIGRMSELPKLEVQTDDDHYRRTNLLNFPNDIRNVYYTGDKDE